MGESKRKKNLVVMKGFGASKEEVGANNGRY